MFDWLLFRSGYEQASEPARTGLSTLIQSTTTIKLKRAERLFVMSKAHDPEADTESEPPVETDETDDGAGDVPEIEEELVTEELRIDGICGVY